MKPASGWWVGMVAGCATVLLAASAQAQARKSPYEVRRFIEPGTGKEMVEIRVPPSPPPAVKMPVAVPPAERSRATSTLTCPAYDWTYGCSATSAGMMMGYYDINGYENMYVGSTNGGVAPLDNSAWGHTTYASVTCGECPWIASHQGKDGRAGLGFVDDYWIDYGNAGPDPYVGNWTEHTPQDCTGDFMGTGMSKYSNTDGGTTFFMYTNGDPLYDYSGCEPSQKDGCRGVKQFVESRGYAVQGNGNFTQVVYPNTMYANGYGFTYDNFKTEIDAGRPVMVHVDGHTMLGVGYNDPSTIYVHDTWDYSTHSMTWGGSYSGMAQYGVTVCRLVDLPIALTYSPEVFSETVLNNGTIGNGITIILTGDTFTATAASGGFVTASNVPTGLTANFTRNTATRITMTLTGAAAQHANADDVANLTVIFADGAFDGGDASAVTDSTKTDLQVDFDDAFYRVDFTTDGTPGAGLTGTTVQTIVEGGNCTAVTANAPVGWHFVDWSSAAPPFPVFTNPITVTNVTAAMTVRANFGINRYDVVFRAGEGGTLTGGVMTITQTVSHGADCTPVLALPDPGYDFLGWTGDYVDDAATITVTGVTGAMDIQATFGTEVAVGRVSGLASAWVDGLAAFTKKPKVYATYTDPVSNVAGKKASMKVLTKIVAGVPEPILACEWTKKIRLYDLKGFKADQKAGNDTRDWIDANQQLLALTQHVASKEATPADQSVHSLGLCPPEITGAVDNGDGTMTITGNWFGTKKPKVWREYVDVKGAIKQQKFKILKPVDGAFLDSKGKCACMNAADGSSQVIVVIPTKDSKGDYTGDLVLENGVGMSVESDPSQR